jgi:hypothetical protein
MKPHLQPLLPIIPMRHSSIDEHSYGVTHKTNIGQTRLSQPCQVLPTSSSANSSSQHNLICFPNFLNISSDAY